MFFGVNVDEKLITYICRGVKNWQLICENSLKMDSVLQIRAVEILEVPGSIMGIVPEKNRN